MTYLKKIPGLNLLGTKLCNYNYNYNYKITHLKFSLADMTHNFKRVTI